LLGSYAVSVVKLKLERKTFILNIYENLATQAITSFFYNEALWKKEIVFDFLLKPFNLQLLDIAEVKAQDNLKGTVPDFTIITKNSEKLRYEVKINNSGLTISEYDKDTRDAYLIRKNYSFREEIPIPKDKILFWEDLFEIIDKKGATTDFTRFDLIREYMCEDIHTLLFTPHEVAMLYSPDTIIAVYEMKEKLLEICRKFLDANVTKYEYKGKLDSKYGIGCYFKKKGAPEYDLFIGLSPHAEKYYSIAKYISGDNWDYFELDKEILAKCNTEEELQQEFNKNAEDVMLKIK